jgi:hypothetical protein
MKAKERETLSYCAGLLDADGYFSIMCNQSGQLKFGRANPQWFECIGLKQVTEAGPRLLQETFGGSIYREKPSAANGKPLFTWRVGSRAAFECARRLLPFLRIKKQQARLLVRLGAHKALRGKQTRKAYHSNRRQRRCANTGIGSAER